MGSLACVKHPQLCTRSRTRWPELPGIGSTLNLPYFWFTMEQIVLQLKNSRKRRLLVELLSELDFVKVTSVIRDGRKVAFANDLVEALLEAKADEPASRTGRRGENTLRSARNFLKNG